MRNGFVEQNIFFLIFSHLQESLLCFALLFEFDILEGLECPKPVQHSLFYDCKHNLKLFGLRGAVKPGEEKGLLLTY